MTTTKTDLAGHLYEAMRTADIDAMMAGLADDLVGIVSDGLPGGFGGRHVGRTAMLRDVWMPVHRMYGVLPEPEQFLEAADDHLVVIGHYRGVVPTTGREFEAAFAHVLRFEGDTIVALRQITDTQRWAEALTPRPAESENEEAPHRVVEGFIPSV